MAVQKPSQKSNCGETTWQDVVIILARQKKAKWAKDSSLGREERSHLKGDMRDEKVKSRQ